jgi:putative ABC transport system permease protein
MTRFYRAYPHQVFSYTSAQGAVNRFEEKTGFFTDAAAIELFNIPFISGNAQSALTEANSIILTEKLAKKYFGNEDPLGKIIQDDLNKVPFKVTGVIQSFSFPTHLKFDYLLSMPTIQRYIDQQMLDNKTWSAVYTYVRLNERTTKAAVESKFPGFMLGFYKSIGETPKEILTSRKIHLQPIADIHLYSKLEKEMYPNSDIKYVYIFSIVAMFILLVAAVNFINISTALAFSRMKEIGMRKVAGATKYQLIGQFIGESLLITLLSAIVALLLVKAAFPLYTLLAGAGNHFNIEELFTLSNTALLLLLVVCCGLLAGSYPAWFVANFNPINSMKGKKDVRFSLNFVRKGLIVFQFAVSVFMIFGTIIVYKQMRLFHNKDMGFDKEQVVAVTMYGPMWKHFGALINDIKKNPAINGFSVVSTLPGDRFSMQPFYQANTTDKDVSSRIMWADERLLPTLKIELKEGRNFFNQFPDIKKNEFILNEAAVKAYKLTNAIGQQFIMDNRDTGEVVGVIKDFNFASLHASVEPLAIRYDPFRANYLMVKVQPSQMPQTLQFLESNIRTLSPESVFAYTFLDEKMKLLYGAEDQLSRVFKAFALFVIFIACLGLFGLSAYSAQLRTREVGIRKVLGASVGKLAVLLLKDFIILVLAGIVFAWPFAWWAMSHWLNGFAYRIPIDGWVFTLSGILSLAGALATVSYQAIKAAMLNPVISLKQE